MSYKRLIPCIFIKDGKAVRWIDDPTVVSKDVIELAKYYSDHGADELIVLDLSDSDEEHDETITLMKRINRVIRIPMIAGGNIRRQEDIKKILYTGAKRAMLNFSKPDSVKLIEDAAKRFGKEKLAVSLNDFDALFKHQHLIQDYSSEIVFMHRLDLNSIMNVTDVPCVIITDTEEESELFKILKCPGVRGLSGRYVSRTDIDCVAFKDKCTEEGIKMTSFESMMEFSQFKTNDQGLIPVIVQHYKTQEILMLAYMNEESFYETIKTGKMTYFVYDGVTGATPLAELKAGETVNTMNMLIGNIRGTIGETSVLAIMIGAMFLILLGIIDLRIPGTYIVTFVIFISIFGGHGFDPQFITAHLCGGGLMLGAWFMATDYVTSPITSKGKILFGICLGCLTGLFRLFGGSAEGVSYAIIISNLLVPLIEKVTLPKPFGKGGEK